MAGEETEETYEPIRCFISYARTDNEIFNGVVDEFKKRLKGLYEAQTGRTLQVFVDRDDLGWGEDWRSGITSSVNSATAFIPLISMKYFTREHCREELMAYYESARVKGVTGLILPVIIAGGANIRAEDSRDEVQVIEKLNYKSIESAILEGYDSGAWLKAMNEITNSLILAVEKAEGLIAKREDEPRKPSLPDSGADEHSQDDVTDVAERELSEEAEGTEEDALGTFELAELFTRECSLLQESTEKASTDMALFAEVLVKEFAKLGDAPTPQAITKAAPAIARAVSGPSQALGSSGADVALHASTADAALRQVVSDIRDSEIRTLQDQMAEQLTEIRTSMGDISGVADQMDEVREYVQMAQLFSVSLRRALTPATRGLEAVRDAARTVSSWKEISL
ncbi:toll/interleukin-1 receptor domain-containing protein [Micromonospora profundi]|uniref:toll/interleukin-1 receptor domain-containing protein n=1 Tax=Micromonospora profundi TaxID=1420889 RepID=UPI0037F8AA9A